MKGLEMKYFVLNPNSKDSHHALASRAAIRVYAMSITAINENLADDLKRWVNKIVKENKKNEKE